MNNRIIKYLTILSAGWILIASCTKKIDIDPEFALDGSRPLVSLEEAENVLTGAYNGLIQGGYYDANGVQGVGGSFSEYVDMMSDNLVESRESLGNFRGIAEWTYVSNTDDVVVTWQTAYAVISATNIILRDIDGLASENPKIANRLKGQALALRAHAHFDLLRYFATTFDRNSSEPGVPYVKVFDVKAKPARNSVKEVYDNIFADLEAAAAAFADIDRPINTSSRSKIDLLAVRAMQARVSLYAGQWQDAVNAATTVIAARPLASAAEFPLIWSDETNTEVIWAVSFETVNDGVPYDNVFFVRGNRAEFKPAAQLVALYDQANDIRYSSYFANLGGRLVVFKHIGRDLATNMNGVVNWKAYRVAEMYLIRAEANYRLNKETEARNDLNALRAARIDGFTPGTEAGTGLLNAILLERRKELAFEGHRFFDLKRLNKTPINRCPSTIDSPSTICSLASSSRAWAWPIPFDETNVNPNIVQNPGY
ncbi:MAG TPA: RagB/SusD family nutrient uptake outer membrane protein [Chitinophagaceae bacterium]|nr:RagB/SusD family nutrient uptake outer membrane protein [Chitinophagaceae bacterium]